jgi:hypothetical protein
MKRDKEIEDVYRRGRLSIARQAIFLYAAAHHERGNLKNPSSRNKPRISAETSMPTMKSARIACWSPWVMRAGKEFRLRLNPRESVH